MLFESIAYAMGAAPGGEGGGANPLAAFAPLIIMFAIFYFLLIRPQQKRAKQHKEMLNNIKKGDHVLTNGGMYGRVTAVEGDILSVDLGNDTVVKMARGYIASISDQPVIK